MTGHQVVANGSTDGFTDGAGIADREVVVACEDVARTYGTGPAAVVAVHGATCRVLAGDRIAISGPSGSGKSTLLHLLAGLEQPTGGTVRRPGRAPGPPAGQIGVVFQGPSLVPALDVTENTALPLVLAGVPEPEARRRAEAALELVGAASLAAKLPEELSGGQAQRAAVARVLALRPRLILADEPTGQLDRATGQHIIDVLLTTADEIGAALVVTTHDQSVAERLSRRWEMHEGRLLPAPKPKDRPTGVSGGPTGPVHRPPREASRPSQRADQADGPVPEPPRPATDPNHPAGQAAPPAPATEPGPPVTPPVAPPVTPPDPPAAGARQGEER